MEAHPHSSRFSGFTDVIDFKKLERETYRYLYLGFVVSIAFHASLFTFAPRMKMEKSVKEPIVVRLEIQPPRRMKGEIFIRRPHMREPFVLDSKEILKKMLVRRQYIQRTPSGKFTFKELPKLEDLIQIVESLGFDFDVGMETIAEVIAEIDSAFSAELMLKFDKGVFDARRYAYEYDARITREDERSISLKEDFITIDDLDTGKYKGLIVQDLADKRKAKGFIYIPVDVWGTTLRPAQDARIAVKGLADGFVKYTGIRIRVDRHLYLDSPDLMLFPVVYITADRYFELGEFEKKNLLEYAMRGGFMILEPYDLGGKNSLLKMIEDAFGSKVRIARVPDDHPIFHCFFDFDVYKSRFPLDIDDNAIDTGFYLEGLFLGDMLAGVMFNGVYGPVWTAHDYENSFFRMSVNTIVYALIREGSIAKKYINRDSFGFFHDGK